MDLEFVVFLKYKRWKLKVWKKDSDQYGMIDLVRDACEFVGRPIIEYTPRYFEIMSPLLRIS